MVVGSVSVWRVGGEKRWGKKETAGSNAAALPSCNTTQHVLILEKNQHPTCTQTHLISFSPSSALRGGARMIQGLACSEVSPDSGAMQSSQNQVVMHPAVVVVCCCRSSRQHAGSRRQQQGGGGGGGSTVSTKLVQVKQGVTGSRYLRTSAIERSTSCWLNQQPATLFPFQLFAATLLHNPTQQRPDISAPMAPSRLLPLSHTTNLCHASVSRPGAAPVPLGTEAE